MILTSSHALHKRGNTIYLSLLDMNGREKEMKVSAQDYPATIARLGEFLQSNNPPLIQDALPDWTPAEREFLLTGLTPEEWEALAEDDAPTDDLPEDDEPPF